MNRVKEEIYKLSKDKEDKYKQINSLDSALKESENVFIFIYKQLLQQLRNDYQFILTELNECLEKNENIKKENDELNETIVYNINYRIMIILMKLYQKEMKKLMFYKYIIM